MENNKNLISKYQCLFLTKDGQYCYIFISYWLIDYINHQTLSIYYYANLLHLLCTLSQHKDIDISRLTAEMGCNGLVECFGALAELCRRFTYPFWYYCTVRNPWVDQSECYQDNNEFNKEMDTVSHHWRPPKEPNGQEELFSKSSTDWHINRTLVIHNINTLK